MFDRWCSWARRSRLEPMKAVAATLMRHAQGILAWFDSRIAKGLIEGINSLVQAAKAKARGYCMLRNLKAIAYLVAGKLDLRHPLETAGSRFLRSVPDVRFIRWSQLTHSNRKLRVRPARAIGRLVSAARSHTIATE